MKQNAFCCFAVDLGATSGRTIIGTLHDNKLEVRELTRFPNTLITANGHCYWDLFALYHEMINGLKTAVERGISIDSIGIDTWGCDFVCIGDDGQILRNPLAYRDPHTEGTMAHYFAHALPKQTVYDKTGIQFMSFNSLFQLYQMREDGNTALRHAAKVLFIPDALSYMLTGQTVCEYTVASTSQLLNPTEGEFDGDLLASIGLRREQFGSKIMPGAVIGTLTDEVRRLTGLGDVPVVAVAGHDTASAVAAVPAEDHRFAYLSSGTWSLMGIETAHPVITPDSYARNFTNESGIDGTTRFLKNICGLWIYERCRSEWTDVRTMSHTELQSGIADCEPFRSVINPDDPAFANPVSMVEAIDRYCRQHGQPVPRTHAEYCRCIFESLALRYREVFMMLQSFADFDIRVLHVIGGGAMNDYLNRFTADACGVTVLAGPQEATAIGNVMMQARAAGRVDDRWAMRWVIAGSVAMKHFEPQDKARWDEAFARYRSLTR